LIRRLLVQPVVKRRIEIIGAMSVNLGREASFKAGENVIEGKCVCGKVNPL